MTQGRGFIISQGVVVTIVLALIGYGITGVWWASSMTQQQEATRQDVQTMVATFSTEIDRQRDRITVNYERVQELSSAGREGRAIMSRVEEDLRLLRGEMRVTNDLLRQVIVDNARRDGAKGEQPK